MDQYLFAAGNLEEDARSRLEYLKRYYEVPACQFPPVPAILDATEAVTGYVTGAHDQFAAQRTRDNTDEY